MIEIWSKSARFNTNKKFPDQTSMILKRGWFSDVEILEIYRHVDRKVDQQDTTIQTETQETLNWNETPKYTEKVKHYNW